MQTRAAFEIEREQISALWTERRAEIAAGREVFTADREHRQTTDAAEREVSSAANDAAETIETGGRRAAREFFSSAVKFVELTFSMLFGWAMAPPKQTAEQIELAERAAEERRPQQEAARAAAQSEAEYDERDFRQKMARQGAGHKIASAWPYNIAQLYAMLGESIRNAKRSSCFDGAMRRHW